MITVMVSSKEQIVLKLSAKIAISRNFVGLCSFKIMKKYLPLIAIISAVMWLARFSKIISDLIVYFLNVVKLQ